MKIYKDIPLGREEVMINWWICEDLIFTCLIKLAVRAKFRFHMKITSLKIDALSVDNLALCRCL